MRVEVRMDHTLGVDGAHERLVEVARRHEVEVVAEGDAARGTLEKKITFLGRVFANYVVEEHAVVVTVLEAPSFLSADRVRALLQEELGRELAQSSGGPNL